MPEYESFGMMLLRAAAHVLFWYFIVWQIAAVIPLPASHSHAEACYNSDGSVACGMAEGQVYLRHNPLPTLYEIVTDSGDWKALKESAEHD